MQDFSPLVALLLADAQANYRKTPTYIRRREQCEKMEFDCTTMLTQDGQEFAQECFTLLDESAADERRYLYRCGLRDCAQLLRNLRLL